MFWKLQTCNSASGNLFKMLPLGWTLNAENSSLLRNGILSCAQTSHCFPLIICCTFWHPSKHLRTQDSHHTMCAWVYLPFQLQYLLPSYIVSERSKVKKNYYVHKQPVSNTSHSPSAVLCSSSVLMLFIWVRCCSLKPSLLHPSKFLDRTVNFK
jgi:hypothetical protein